MKVLIPYFNSEGGNSKSFQQATKSLSGDSLLRRVFDLPLDVVNSQPRATTVLLLLAVTALLATQSPLLIMVVPTLGWRFLSVNENFWGQHYHYDLVLMPIVFAALIDGVLRARRDSWRPLRVYARAAPALALVVGLFLCTRYPFGQLFNPATYAPSPRAQAAERILSKIPDGVTVETDLGLIAKLTNRTQVFFAGMAAPVVPEYLLITNTAQDRLMADPVKYAVILHPGHTYVLVHAENGYTLVRRVS
jgi:hypothetical protein